MNNDVKLLTKRNGGSMSDLPVFVETEKMIDRINEISKEIGQRAFEFSQNRHTPFATQLDDWFKAESEILRPTPVEITETNDSVAVHAAVPGFKPEEIEISLEGDQLILSGEARSEEKKEDESTFYSEWRSNRFFRQLTLPTEVETENVEAVLKDGVLQMSMKKKEEKEAVKIAAKTA